MEELVSGEAWEIEIIRLRGEVDKLLCRVWEHERACKAWQWRVVKWLVAFGAGGMAICFC